MIQELSGGKGGTVVTALVSHPCHPGSNPDIHAIYGLSCLLLVLSFVMRGFSPGSLVSPSPQNQLFQILIRPGVVDEEPLCGCATSKLSFISIGKCSRNALFLYFRGHF